MNQRSQLSRRERQIMDAVYALGEATVNQVVEGIPSPPTAMAVRRMMHILEEKGYLRRRKSGREVIYVPRQAIQSLEVVSLIGTAGRKRRPDAVRGQGQPELFPAEPEQE